MSVKLSDDTCEFVCWYCKQFSQW